MSAPREPSTTPCSSALRRALTPCRPVSSAELARFTDIIDGILATADLETISRKKIRQGLEAALGGRDLSDQKVPWADRLTPWLLPRPFTDDAACRMPLRSSSRIVSTLFRGRA